MVQGSKGVQREREREGEREREREHPLSELHSLRSLGLGFLVYTEGFHRVGAVTISTSPSGKARNAEFGMKLPEFIFNGGHTWTFLKRIRLSVAHL